MRIYPEVFKVMQELNQSMKDKEFTGRIADGGASLVFLMSMVANAGDGDHVEIGTLFGASAIAVALVKRKLGLEGEVYCIDPYDAEKREEDIRIIDPTTGQPKEDQSLLVATPEELRKNAKLFDVKLNLIQKYSDPWPEELEENNFVTAYIDGDHMRDMPYKDFENVSKRTSDYIGFDNYEEGYPDVFHGVNKIIHENEDWSIFYKNGIFLSLRRRLPSRKFGPIAPVTAF